MADRIEDGGPAFPVADYDHQVFQPKDVPEARRLLSGMTLRDYFAAKAMQGLCANPGAAFQANPRSGWGLVNCELENVAVLSYSIADAMLKAREVRNG